MSATPAPPADKTAGIPGVTRRHRPSDFYHERTNFQFIKHSRRWAILSGSFMVLSIVLLFARGLNFGIDFEGGTSWQVQMENGQDASVGDVRDVLRPLGFDDAEVRVLSGSGGERVDVQAHLVADPITEISEALAVYGNVTEADVQFKQATEGGSFTFTPKPAVKPTKAGVEKALAATDLKNPTVKIEGGEVVVSAKVLPASPTETVGSALAKYAGVQPNDVSISSIGPTWGQEVSRKAAQALAYFFVLLAIYLSIRFEFKMAMASIVAVIHDIIFTMGVYALLQFEVTPATVTAFLTILGFSLYDTVVVFDKVRENQKVLTATGRSTYGEMVNESLNVVLMRSLSTSLVALLPVISLLVVGTGVFGATVLEDFALALAAGLFIGSYSSLFVVAPLLAWWKGREPQYRALEERRRRIAASAGVAATPEMSVELEGLDLEQPAPVGVPGPPAVGRTIQPRARNPRGRKRR